MRANRPNHRFCHNAAEIYTAQNLIKYASGKRLQLDLDLLALQRALNNRVPEMGVEEDWRLPLILEQNFPKLSAESTDASQRII